jgi:hypothetical protein
MKHEIIYTEQYALIVSDEEMKKGDFNVPSDFDRTSDISITSEEDLEVVNDRFNGYKKVIAHRPLTDAPMLEGVLLLPPFSRCQEYGVENEVMEFKKVYGSLGATDYELSAFLKGYNKARETYKYTLSDLRRAFTTGRDLIVEKRDKFGEWEVFTKFIDSLQQPKRPKSILLETIYRVKSGTIQEHKDGLAGFEYYEPKTTTNSQGQTELVGTYFYE